MSFLKNVSLVSHSGSFVEISPLDVSITVDTVRPRKRFKTDGSQARDKFNLSNDIFYEVSKDGGRHRVRQTFGQLVVEHAYPAQKLQLPFVNFPHKSICYFADMSSQIQYKTRLSKQEARSFHRPALQFPSNIELHFSKVRTAKKKKDKAGRKLGKGGNIGEGLRKSGDLSLRDTSNFVLWEYSVRVLGVLRCFLPFHTWNRKNIHPSYQISEWEVRWLITTARRMRRMTMYQRSASDPGLVLVHLKPTHSSILVCHSSSILKTNLHS
jgi:Protein of unknown function (DUF3591)